MRLSYAFVADSAQFTPIDGRLWVLGGDFDTFGAQAFPVTHPSLTLVVKIIAQPTECGHEHRLRIELLNSAGDQIHPEISSKFSPQVNPQFRHRPVGVGLALNFLLLVFPHAGDYAFHILVDDLELGVVPIYLTSIATGP